MQMKVALVLLAIVSLATCIVPGTDVFNKYQVQILNAGTYTAYPQVGDKVSVHYVGTFLDGKEFDSSVKRNDKFSFNVGRGSVIKCWDEVILTLTIGDKVVVTCPPETAYGSRGAGSVIPPNSTLKFEIEMFSFGSHTASN